jgi:hypothetical protein
LSELFDYIPIPLFHNVKIVALHVLFSVGYNLSPLGLWLAVRTAFKCSCWDSAQAWGGILKRKRKRKKAIGCRFVGWSESSGLEMSGHSLGTR